MSEIKDFAYNEYWETDEFEDLVTRSLIGLYETRVKKEKRAPKCIRFNEDTFKRFKSIGCYFAPHDRLCCIQDNGNDKSSFIQEIDILNDGLPTRATLTLTAMDDDNDSYLRAFYLEHIPFLPKPFASEIRGRYYRITQIFFENHHVSGCGTVLAVDREGKMQSCYIKDVEYDPITKRVIPFKNRPVLDKNLGGCEDYYSVWGSVAIQFYQDRLHLWNVQAYDGTAKATFGVYPQQIQSLFYARDLPQTDTGRKRPILHWVQSHQRRIKSGTEVDVEEYLRGTHEFVMNDTKFRITNPLKERRK